MSVLHSVSPVSPLTLAYLPQVDDQELADELAELEQDELNKRLTGADSVPLHLPGVPVAGQSLFPPLRHALLRKRGSTAKTPAQAIEEDEEEAELRELQAALAM